MDRRCELLFATREVELSKSEKRKSAVSGPSASGRRWRLLGLRSGSQVMPGSDPKLPFAQCRFRLGKSRGAGLGRSLSFKLGHTILEILDSAFG